jgi:hypothetical protein
MKRSLVEESSVDCYTCKLIRDPPKDLPKIGRSDNDFTSSFPNNAAAETNSPMKEENSSSSSSCPAECCCWCRSNNTSSYYDGAGMIHVFGRLAPAATGSADDGGETTLPQLQHLFSARSMRCFMNKSSNNSNSTRSNLLSHSTERMSLKIVEGIARGGFGTVVKVSSLKTPNNTTKVGAAELSSSDSYYGGGGGVMNEGSRDCRGNEHQQQQVEHIMSIPEMALKVIPKKLIRSISRELEAIKGILDNSPFIQKTLGIYDSDNNVLFLSEIIVGGDLFTHIARGLRFGEDQGRFILAELFLGLQHIHSCNFIHGDIKVTQHNIYLAVGGLIFLIMAVASLLSMRFDHL